MLRSYFVYMLASESRELYVGITNDLARRMAEHKAGLIKGYASKHGTTRLVHFEMTSDVRAAITREKQVKAWTRAKGIALIERGNPDCETLAQFELRLPRFARDDRVTLAPGLQIVTMQRLLRPVSRSPVA
jgi:putative endonuclease